jgi:ribosomal protein S18 acetylase RimI-like enzyme
MSLYAEYLKERTSDFIIEDEFGFATYRFVDEKTVYIVDIYVKPEHRYDGIASSLADDIVRIAKQRGCTTLMGTVQPSAKNSTASIKVLMAYGMTLASSGNDFVIFKKEI